MGEPLYFSHSELWSGSLGKGWQVGLSLPRRVWGTAGGQGPAQVHLTSSHHPVHLVPDKGCSCLALALALGGFSCWCLSQKDHRADFPLPPTCLPLLTGEV